MGTEPAPAEIEAGAQAVDHIRHFIASDGYPAIRIGSAHEESEAVLAAVLPDHDARREAEIRADERRRIIDHIQARVDDAVRRRRYDTQLQETMRLAWEITEEARTHSTGEDPT